MGEQSVKRPAVSEVETVARLKLNTMKHEYSMELEQLRALQAILEAAKAEEERSPDNLPFQPEVVNAMSHVFVKRTSKLVTLQDEILAQESIVAFLQGVILKETQDSGGYFHA